MISFISSSLTFCDYGSTSSSPDTLWTVVFGIMYSIRSVLTTVVRCDVMYASSGQPQSAWPLLIACSMSYVVFSKKPLDCVHKLKEDWRKRRHLGSCVYVRLCKPSPNLSPFFVISDDSKLRRRDTPRNYGTPTYGMSSPATAEILEEAEEEEEEEAKLEQLMEKKVESCFISSAAYLLLHLPLL